MIADRSVLQRYSARVVEPLLKSKEEEFAPVGQESQGLLGNAPGWGVQWQIISTGSREVDA